MQHSAFNSRKMQSPKPDMYFPSKKYIYPHYA